MRRKTPISLTAIFTLVFLSGASLAQETLTQGTNFSIDAAADGRLAIDLLGGIWIVPKSGGETEVIASGLLPARRPKWSPDASSIAYQARAANQDQLWLYRYSDDTANNISDGQFFDQHPHWHPDGERIVYSSDRRDSGFDLWEMDLRTRLTWRVTHQAGDETEPAWSADGRDLVYIHQQGTQWSLMLRRMGQPDQVLVSATHALSSPSWRPDGSLITFLNQSDDGVSIDMIILSEPLLVRPLVSGEDFFIAPVTWLDRQELLYAANGVIRQRHFNSWTSSTVPFRATVSHEPAPPIVSLPPRELPVIDEPDGKLVIRVERMFDGLGGGYRDKQDIVIDRGRIVAIEDQQERPGVIVVDMRGYTALPGFIDSYASLPGNADETLGPLLLSWGVTTIVADHANSAALNMRWSGKEMPGPRLLAASKIANATTDGALPWLVTIDGDLTTGTARQTDVTKWQSLGVPVLASNWQVGMASGASMLLGAESIPVSPGGLRYDDIALANGSRSVTIISGLAAAGTPGLADLMQSRQARLQGNPGRAIRRFVPNPNLADTSTPVVIGSQPNGLPPGLGLHAEFRALLAAGLKPEQVLKSAGVNAAAALGLGLRLGRIAVGASADLVLVDGDPLADIKDTQNVVGVVRNGRFYSAIGLIERAEPKNPAP